MWPLSYTGQGDCLRSRCMKVIPRRKKEQGGRGRHACLPRVPCCLRPYYFHWPVSQANKGTSIPLCGTEHRDNALEPNLVPIAFPVDYEQSLFFLGPWSKTSETRKWPRAWLKAREGALVSRVSRLRHSTLARACTPHTKSEEKERVFAVYFSGEALGTPPRLTAGADLGGGCRGCAPTPPPLRWPAVF